MSRDDSPPGVPVSYRQQYRRCGKATCSRCAAGGPGHGPYWYAFWTEGGRSRSCYLGKQAPLGVVAPPDHQPAAPVSARAPRAPLRVHTLGGFTVWRGDAAIPPTVWSGQRAASLFKCLLSVPGHRLAREQIIELLWPEADPSAGATNLRTTIHLLRQVLDGASSIASHLRLEGDVLVLAPGGDGPLEEDWLDATAFLRAAHAARAGQDAAACRTALARYGGVYLPDDLYAPWATLPRASLQQQYLHLLLHLAALSAAQGEVDEAEKCLGHMLAVEPGHEEAAATLMGLLAAAGRRGDALRVYQALATTLDEDLDVAPSAEIAALRIRLLAQERAPLAATIPPHTAPARRLTNLPLAMTSFVGRHWDLAAVTDAQAGARLVTLTGPGGCGKTRLALEVAERLVTANSYSEGVWLVELAVLADPALVLKTVATTLGVVEHPRQTLLATLVQFLQSRQTLLILDNCEHLIGACAELSTALLQACPHLRLLATSREGLAVAGEHTYLVPSMTVPDPAHLPPLERLEDYEAVTLFLERAHARRPELALTAANAGAVAAICARLDGLPLALELAAARVGVLPVEAIAARLDDRFRLLTGGPRTALPRQQTLHATIDWSYALLDERERALQRRLAVFAGGWALEATALVCSGDGLPDAEVLDLLGGLVDKSLVLLEAPDGNARYRLLETVRQYSWERLVASADVAAVRERHLAWCLSLAEQAEPQLKGSQQEWWLARLEAEHDNLRAALDWSSHGAGDQAMSVQLAGALGRFWEVRGHLSEGRGRLEQSLAVRVGVTPMLRARALHGAGRLAWAQGAYGTAQALHEESLALSRGLGDRQGIARALNDLGLVARAQGAYGAARALHEVSLALWRELDDRWGMAHALSNLGTVASCQGDYPEARARLEEGLALFRALEDRQGIAMAVNALGDVAWAQGDYGRAAVRYQESIRLLHALGDKQGIANTLSDLGDVAWAQGDDGTARALYKERLALSQGLGDRWGIATSLNNLGNVALHQGNWERAAALHEQALALFRALGDKRSIALALNHLGLVAEREGDHGRAVALFAESLQLGRDLGARTVLAEVLEGLAWVAAAQGQARRAARLGGAAAALRDALGAPLPPSLRADHERVRQNLRAALGDEACMAAWAQGRALRLNDAVTLASHVEVE